MLRWTRSKAAGRAVAFALLLSLAATGAIAQEQAAETRSTGNPNFENFGSPLDRLKARSPQQRWESIRGSVKELEFRQPTEAIPAPPLAKEDDQPIGEFRVLDRSATSERSVDPFVKTGHQSQFENSARSADEFPTAEEVAMPSEFPVDEETTIESFQEETFLPPAEGTIYDQIEDEFPRLHVEPTREPVQETPEFDEELFVEPAVTERRIIAQEPETDYGNTPLDLPGEEERERRSMGNLTVSPKDLKPLSSILPYFDYEPDQELQKTDPYRNIYPRPVGAPEEEDSAKFPAMVDLGDDVYQMRSFAHVDYRWAATDLWHYPLYFQDPAFERYGHTLPAPFQPFASFGRFGVQFFGLPYQMALHPIDEPIYTLGWHRPGEYTPGKFYQVPLNADAAVRTTLFYAGMIWAFP